MGSGSLVPLPWRLLDALDYWLTQARLYLVDVVCGPQPEPPADETRNVDRERLRKAFPEIGIVIRH